MRHCRTAAHGFEFNKGKNASNQSKHGYPLALGWIVLQNAVADIDDPRDYMTEFGLEERRIAYGLVAGGLFVSSTPCGMRFAA